MINNDSDMTGNGVHLPLITVVTVVYNDVKHIEETILSVINQTYPNIEYIIVDGGSTDGTVDIIKKYSDSIAYWVSEPDKGIYDAMNKGICKATGEWINFMNSGDVFHSSNVIIEIVVSDVFDTKVGVIYGDTFLYKDRKFIKKFLNKPFWSTPIPYRTGKGICHQSMFTRTKLAQKLLFNLKYRISADFDMTYRIYKLGYLFIYMPITVCNFDITGMSSSRLYWKATYLETGRILNCRFNLGYWLFFVLKYIKEYLKFVFK